MRQDRALKIGMAFMLLVLALSFASASYMRSNPQYTQFMGDRAGEFDKSMCQQGQDFIIQISPFGCTPAVVRSDLLEEQNVPVFCQLGAIKINPLIDVEAIDSISFSGEYPPEVEGIAFHPARAALGIEGDLNNPVLNNIGYVVIVLKKQANASAMPDYVSGNLTAKIRYDVKNAFGVGRANFYLPELDDSAWEKEKYQYSFWDGKGYLRAEDIESDRAVISVYSNNNKISSVSLNKGETSEEIYLPGFDCLASLKVKLNSLENSDTRALLRVNAEVFEVGKGEKFLDNKCQVVSQPEKQGLVQKVKIKCNEDDGINRLDLMISPKVKLNIDGEEKEVKVGDWLYKTRDESRSVYLAYIGTRGDPRDVNDLFIYVISMPEHRESSGLIEGELNYYNIIVGELLTGDFKGGVVDITSDVIKRFAGLANIGGRFIAKSELHIWIDYGEERTFKDSKIILNGFAGPQDMDVIEDVEDYQNAIDDYETIMDSFSEEPYVDESAETFGEEALYNQIVLVWDAEQKSTVLELCDEFKNLYSNSDKNIDEYCNDNYKLSNQERAINYVTINGETKKITLDGIYEPMFEDYGAKIVVQSSGGVDYYNLRKNKLIYVGDSDTIQLTSLELDSAEIKTIIGNKEKTISLEKDVSKGLGEYSFTLTKVNLKKTAKVSLVPGFEDAGTEADFGFKIGIEKRAFKLSPDKIKEKIDKLDSEIGRWQNYSEKIGKVVKGLKTACLATGAGLVFKNFLADAGGAGIARKYVMRGSGGWYERCVDMVNAGVYVSQEKCLLNNSNTIDKDVDKLSELITEQNEEIQDLEKDITKIEIFGKKVVNTSESTRRYSEKIISYWDDDFEDSFPDPDGKGETIYKDEMIKILSYEGWENGNYNREQLREIELWAKVLKDAEANPELRVMAEKRLYSELLDVKINADNYVDRLNFESDTGMGGSSMVGSFEKLNEIVISERITLSQTKYSSNKISGEDYVFSFKDSSTRKKYLIVYDEDGVVKSTHEIGDDNSLTLLEDQNYLDFYFKKYDSLSYKNQYKNAKIRYYETEPYKGLPAIVPFDLSNGWYAATKQTLPVFGNMRAFDESGAVSSFYLCNVGENGLEENIGGDDDCLMINKGTGQPYDQFPGLDEREASKVIGNAKKAIEQASRAYSPGLSGKVKILGERIEVGKPAVDIPEIECQDLMSPKDCQLLFNVCDPVICPSSRCDFGGAYPVRDVIQSGIIGSLVLCFPNIEEGILIPFCLTGVQAGIDGWLSVKTSYKDCLQNALDTGEMIGICDEIYSIHACEFFWRQALPLADIIIPKVIGALVGQNVRGGGEYLTVADSWTTAKNSVTYFTQYYGANSNKAFKARSTEEVGTEFCKLSISAIYAKGADIIDTITEPDSPSQFHGRFDEIPFSSVTVPPTSHYKVFYHIFAGKDSGAYYQVYLKGIPGSSYYRDTSSTLIIASGYIETGGYASETRDLTAPSGYKQLCINVNGQEECGFKEVSTSFAIDYISDQYVASQIQETNIRTERECVSGSASAYSLLNPNVQEGVGDLINPEIYNQGIIRICATDNPGLGSDPYAGTENSRWREVGYCDNENIKCWLDTETVKDIIEFTEIAEGALENVTQSYLEILRNKEGYISEKEFASKVKEISDEKDASGQLTLIEEIFDKVFLNGEKAYLFLLRGNAYAEIARIPIKRKIEEAKTKGIVGEEEREEEAEEVTIIGEKIWQIAKDYADERYNVFRIIDGRKKYDNVCARFVTQVLVDAGIKTQGIELDSGKCDSIDYMIQIFEDTDDFIEIDMSRLKKGDIVILGRYDEKTQHIAIFSHYNDDKTKVYVYGDPGGRLQRVKLENYAVDSNKWYIYKSFRYTKGDVTSDAIEREKWTLERAIEEVERLRGEYSDNEEFVMELYEDGLLTQGEYEEIKGEDMAWLKRLLLEKKASEAELADDEIEEDIGDKTEEFTSPVFEFKDGKFERNLYYKYSDGKWHWSEDKEKWNFVSNVWNEDLSDENNEFIQDLVNGNYSAGLRLLIRRTMTGKGDWFGLPKPRLYTTKVEMKSDREFIFRYEKLEGFPVVAFYFKFVDEEDKWMWKHSESSWIDVSKETIGYYEEPTGLIKSLKNKDFYQGTQILFSENI